LLLLEIMFNFHGHLFDRAKTTVMFFCVVYMSVLDMFASPLSVWPLLFCGAGHEKRRGEQLKWSLAFRLYIGSFPCA